MSCDSCRDATIWLYTDNARDILNLLKEAEEIISDRPLDYAEWLADYKRMKGEK